MIKTFLISVVMTLFVCSAKIAYAQKLATEPFSYSSFKIDSRGNLYTWGDNTYGQLGIGNTTQQNISVKVSLLSGVTSWVAAAAGSNHSLAIGSDGNLYAWGYNGFGQLGIGNTAQQNIPAMVPLPSGVTSWTAMAGGWNHSLAIGSNGNLYVWGDNTYSQLGIGNTTQQTSPVKVPFPSGVTSWTEVTSGWFYSLAIGNDGNLYTWGYNAYGQLGIGNTTQQNSPVKVPFPSGVISWTAVTAGSNHSLAIGSDGNLYTWGNNGNGQLGIGNTTNQNTPVKVPFPSGVISWTAITAGSNHSLAIGSDGNLYTWGNNGNGQLGIGNTTNQNTPVKVPFPSGLINWTAITAGSNHSLAIGSDGNLYTWGNNTYGQLGIGDTTQQNTPVRVIISSVGGPVDYLNIINSESSYIASCVVSSGAIILGKSLLYNFQGTPHYKISPYESNFAATALLDDPTPANLVIVKNWMIWVFNHLNLDGSIYDYYVDKMSGGTELPSIDAYAHDGNIPNYDSKDSYASTFLTLARKYAEVIPADTSWLRGYSDQLESIGNALYSCVDDSSHLFNPDNNDGLTVAKTDYQVKYTMDNSETNEGFRDMVWLEQNVSTYHNVLFYQNLLNIQNSGFSNLWDSTASMYCVGEGIKSPNWNTFYPDASCQVYPIWAGVIPSSSTIASNLYNSFNLNYPDWQNGKYYGELWSIVCYSATVMKDTSRVNLYLTCIQRLLEAGKNPPEWNNIAASFILRSAKRLSLLTTVKETGQQ
jgi:alpha-tubulin suppressor-like RCC1 family protein